MSSWHIYFWNSNLWVSQVTETYGGWRMVDMDACWFILNFGEAGFWNYMSEPFNVWNSTSEPFNVWNWGSNQPVLSYNEWQGFLGEFQDAQKPLFVRRRAPSLLLPTNNLGEVYLGAFDKSKQKQQSDYHIEGCYANRSFTIFNSSGNVVAEVCFT